MFSRFCPSLLVLLFMLVPGMSDAQTIKVPDGVYVMAGSLPEANGNPKVKRSDVLERLESTLRDAGIRVLSERQWMETSRVPVLYLEWIKLDAVRIIPRLTLKEPQARTRDEVSYSTVWSDQVDHFAATASQAQLLGAVEDLAKRFVAGARIQAVQATR